ncbi:uncharacterized protein BYT42DRAFT_499097 [Radiomyces spectabilis]|uniref:uncharacterized protein n=1 Tax=Radiomyces spectabilis TaxID=64574 RepID=UPI002220C786|nr:uncharacterized protein BYT42DRAFT_499097 [Radiomyces spectabilis]KAI8374558.1 hypothetical protein BYT42DRAFT_499097 [Radiomyces spectabilis]
MASDDHFSIAVPRQPFSYPPAFQHAGLFTNPRKWSWWHLLTVAIALLALAEAFFVLIANARLQAKLSPIRVDLREYPSIQYHPLDTKKPLNLPKNTRVYHVAKEFGPASMGGMGMILTAITTAQQQTGLVQVSVVLPYYSFLKSDHIEFVVNLAVDVREGWSQRPVSVPFQVSRLEFLVDNVPIPVYLIGPAQRHSPFDLAFQASDALQIYYSPKGLPQEWKDLYFVKAAAAFLLHQASAKSGETDSGVDLVHLHGATNAYIAYWLTHRSNPRHTRSPAIVYTLHDYLDELEYSNTIPNVHKFLDNTNDTNLQRYMHQGRLFMSSLAIDQANVATFVSRAMAQDLVEDKLDFHYKDLVMDSILRKTEQGRFFGVTNGVDPGLLNPFINSQLTLYNFQYPAFARRLLDQHVFQQHPDALSSESDIPISWSLSSNAEDLVSTAKKRAKEWLIGKDMLKEQDLDRPVVLYVGRFQYNKGLEIFDEACQYFARFNMMFVIIGQPNNYPLQWVKALEDRYPKHVKVMSTLEEQLEWLVYYRAAADFVFVPSLTESFGLVAVEGLLFGAPVISTGVGGLGEFLIDRPSQRSADLVTVQPTASGATVVGHAKYNAYIFQPSTLEASIADAHQDYQRYRGDCYLHEESILRMMLNAFSLGWSRSGQQGPVYDYLRLYELAISDHASKT